MRSFYSDSKGNFREGNFIIFLEISIDNYLIIKNNKKEIERLYGDKEVWIKINGEETLNKEIDYDRISELYKQNYKYVIQSVLLLSTFLEAFINEIGQVGLGKKYFKDNLEKSSILQKWELVLKLIFGQGISKDKAYYRDIKKIISERNNLAHYKTKIVSKVDEESFDYLEDILETALNSMSSLFLEFENLNKKQFILSLVEIKSQLSRI